MNEAVDRLEEIYGPPSDAAFGSAVFRAPVASAQELEPRALECYRRFVGGLWERYGEATWMGPWKTLYRRDASAPRDVLGALRSIEARDAASIVPLLLEARDSAESALAAVFDDPATTDLAIFAVGDGAAMSGLLLAGRRQGGEGVFLVLLLD